MESIIAALIWFAFGIVLGIFIQADREKKDTRPVYVYEVFMFDQPKINGKHMMGYVISHIPGQDTYSTWGFIRQLSDDDAILYMRGLL